MRYNEKQIENVGKHDFAPVTGPGYPSATTVSTGIFAWEMRSNGKSMKKGKTIVRVSGKVTELDKINQQASNIADLLDKGEWRGAKNVKV